LPVDRAAIDWARRVVLAREPAPPDGETVGFLLRDYVASGDETVRALVEHGLTTALSAAVAERDPAGRLQWLRVLLEGSVLSDDPRLHDTVAEALPSSLDALEQVMRRRYEPGEGLVDADCPEQLHWAVALLDAFDLCARLPYAMLADELVQHARRQWWLDDDGRFDADFSVNCHALSLLSRLGALHADPDYRAAVAVPPRTAHVADARRAADRLAAEASGHPRHAAVFGAAMLDWFALELKLQ
jgi:hypothetical protein